MSYIDKDKQREFQKGWVKGRRLTWLASHGPCSRCRSWEGLEVHHRDPTQKVSHKVWSWSELRRERELSKCVVLCHGCHQEITSAFLRRPITHGTSSGYRRGCRCEACTDLHSKSLRAWRKSKAA